MKKIILFAILLFPLFATAQKNKTVDNLKARQSITLGSKKVSSISNNSSLTNDTTALVTMSAIKTYVDSNSGGGGGGGGAVSSVFGRTGAVVAQSGDYNAGQVTNTPAGNIAATDVQAALNELDTEKLSAEVDGSITNEIQTLSISNDFLSISSGNTVVIPGDDLGDHIATQNINIGSNYLSPDGGAQGIKLDAGGNLIIESAGFVGSELKITEASAYGNDAIILKAPNNMSGNINFNFPNSEGTVDQVLRTDGSGNLSWVDQTGGAGTSSTVQIVQAGHSFNLGASPWNGYGFIPVALQSGNYVLAQADSISTTTNSFITAISGDTLTLQSTGHIDLPVGTTLSEGYYYLSISQAGYVTSVEPDTSQALIFVEKGADNAQLLSMRIVDYTAEAAKPVLRGTKSDTTINLNNNNIFRLDLTGFTGSEFDFTNGATGATYVMQWFDNSNILSFTDSLRCFTTDSEEAFPNSNATTGTIHFYKDDTKFYTISSTVSCEVQIVAEYQAVLDYATGQSITLPHDTVQSAQNAFVKGLVDAGIWSKLDMLYLFRSGQDETFAKIDYKRLSQVTESGTVNYAANTGFTSDNSTGYFSTGFNTDGGTNFVQNSASLIMGGTGFNNQWDFGVASGSNFVGAIKHSGNSNIWIRIMGESEHNSLAHGGTDGFWIFTRSSASDVDCYKNGTLLGNVDHTSSAPGTNEIQIMRHSNQSTNTSDGTFEIFGLGSNLSASEITTFNSLFNTYKSSVAP